MSSICLNVSIVPGTSIIQAIENCIKSAKKLDMLIQFNFNDVTICVSSRSTLEHKLNEYTKEVESR